MFINILNQSGATLDILTPQLGMQKIPKRYLKARPEKARITRGFGFHKGMSI